MAATARTERSICGRLSGAGRLRGLLGQLSACAQVPYPYMVLDVERAVRYIRYHAKEWNADPDKIALVGGSAGGFLSNMVAC